MPELSLYFVIVCIIEGNNRFVDHLTHGHVSFSTAGIESLTIILVILDKNNQTACLSLLDF